MRNLLQRWLGVHDLADTLNDFEAVLEDSQREFSMLEKDLEDLQNSVEQAPTQSDLDELQNQIDDVYGRLDERRI